jgi:hypothetical protein
MTGSNSNVIMSGWKVDNPDNERRETTRRNLTSESQRQQTVSQAVLVMGVAKCYRVKARVKNLDS